MNLTEQSTDYSGLSDLLSRSGSPLVLAELHGGLSGVIVAGGRDASVNWLNDVLDDCAADSATLAELARGLEQLGDATWQALSGMSLEFTPLLPDEDSAIEQRAEALALWCHGFLSGLVVGGLDLSGQQREMPEAAAELIGDLVEISKAGADSAEIEDPESGDPAWMELVEFVRVGAQYLFEEMASRSNGAPERTLH